MKYYITDKNMKSTAGIRDIPYFSTKSDRDTWVKDNLLEGKTIDEALATSNEYNTQILNIVNTSIEVPYNASLVNKNYVIVRDSIADRDLFYIITDMYMNENRNMVTLTLELDSFVTYFEWINNVNNLELVQGHGPFVNYFDYEYDGGRRTVSKIEAVKRNQVSEGDYTADSIKGRHGITIVVYRQLRANEEPAIINGISVPYKIFIAPYPVPLTITDGSSQHLIDYKNLLEYYHKVADGLTYKIQVLNYEFFKAGSDTGSFWEINNGRVVNFESNGTRLLELKEYDFSTDDNTDAYIRNSFDFEVPSTGNHFTYLNGLEDKKVMIYGMKEIEWPFNMIKPSAEKMTLHIGSFLAPNENQQFYTWNGQVYVRDEDNTWDNETELAVFVNQLNEYKANNPVQSKLSWLEGLSGLANPLNYLKPASAVASVAQAGVKTIGTATGRMNQKRAPETVKGDANTYFNVVNAPIQSINTTSDVVPVVNLNLGYLTTLATYRYYGNDRISVITSLYKYGATYSSSLFVKDYDEIKRPKFNFIRLQNFVNSDIEIDIPNNVIEDMDAKLSGDGIRIWNSDYLNFDLAGFNGNGDLI